MSDLPEFFTCPICGSHYFRTNGDMTKDDPSKWTGQCKGHLMAEEYGRSYTGCSFTWNRAYDDKLWNTSPVHIKQKRRN